MILLIQNNRLFFNHCHIKDINYLDHKTLSPLYSVSFDAQVLQTWSVYEVVLYLFNLKSGVQLNLVIFYIFQWIFYNDQTLIVSALLSDFGTTV